MALRKHDGFLLRLNGDGRGLHSSTSQLDLSQFLTQNTP